MPVWAGLIIAIAATAIMNFGLALQKRGAINLPKIGQAQGIAVAQAFFTNWVWLIGTAGLLSGWGLYLFSTKIAPISLVQPTLGMGLVVLALFSVFYLKEKIQLMEWLMLIGMITGMILLGLSAGEEAPKELPNWTPLLIVTGVILALALLAYILGKQDKLGGIRPDALLGIVSGLFVGLGAIYSRAMFLFLGQDQDGIGLGICLPVMILANVIGVGVMQSGFQHGKALVVVALEAVLNKVVAIVAGVIALNEALPADKGLAFMRIIAFALILIGSGGLSRFGKEK